MMMMVSRPKSNLPYLTQREYLVRTTTNQSDISSLRYLYVLGTFRTKKGKRLQARIFNPIIHHVSDDDDDDDDDLDRQGKTIISATNNATHKISCVREGKIEVVGSLSLLGGLCNIQ